MRLKTDVLIHNCTLRLVLGAALCLLPLTAQAGISWEESPVFRYDAFECLAGAGTGSGDSALFAYDPYECLPGAGTGSGDSALFAYDAFECAKMPGSGFADSEPFFASYVPVNGDCSVNVLDLILIRNRIGQDVFADGNSRADVNNDGRIDVLDLIVARNIFGTPCSQ